MIQLYQADGPLVNDAPLAVVRDDCGSCFDDFHLKNPWSRGPNDYFYVKYSVCTTWNRAINHTKFSNLILYVY